MNFSYEKIKHLFRSFLNTFSTQREFQFYFSKELEVGIQVFLKDLQVRYPGYKFFFFSEFSIEFPNNLEDTKILERSREIYLKIKSSNLISEKKVIFWYYLFSENKIISIHEINLGTQDMLMETLPLPKNQTEKFYSIFIQYMKESSEYFLRDLQPYCR